MMFARLVAAALLLLFAAIPAAAAKNPYGLWSLSNGKVTVQVSQCGTTLCGIIAGLKEPISKIDGRPKVDRENPLPALRQRPLIGLPVLIGMKPAGADTWQGTIYNPDDGRTYRATLRLVGAGLKVEGCVARILCRTNSFVRAD